MSLPTAGSQRQRPTGASGKDTPTHEYTIVGGQSASSSSPFTGLRSLSTSRKKTAIIAGITVLLLGTTVYLMRAWTPHGLEALPRPFRDEAYGLSCDAESNINEEFHGTIVSDSSSSIVKSAKECAQKCRALRLEYVAGKRTGKGGCNVWVFCEGQGGCSNAKNKESARANFGECRLKYQHIVGATDAPAPNSLSSDDGVSGWRSGTCLSLVESITVSGHRDWDLEASRKLLRDDPANTKVFFDVEIKGKPIGRIVMVLYMRVSPLAAENMRALCTGETGRDLLTGAPMHFRDVPFYRIIHNFIDQTGIDDISGSVYGGMFKDDAGGLKLKHDRPGLLSAAHMGPNTNEGHFSILVNSASHLDGIHTIFGEVVEGMNPVMRINALADLKNGKAGNEVGSETGAKIVECGQILKDGTIISPPK